MSTTTSNAAREAAARPTGKASRLRHTPGGAGLGKNAGHEAQRLAAAILEVLAGVRTPSQAAEALGVSQARYFQIETRAMQALVASCEPRPRGPGRSADRELTALRRQHERLQRELSRQQTLVLLAQRTIGLTPPKAAVDKPSGKDKSQKRRRRPVVRALRAAEALNRRSQEGQSQEGRSQEAQSQEAASAAATPEIHEVN
ncbi:MAG TPA: hypothetical protein VG013_08285 [Gemmataceae bacterium]|jgi:hypothetical protein|nr:hypothetical protein [Gemmataceae bacterium]